MTRAIPDDLVVATGMNFVSRSFRASNDGDRAFPSTLPRTFGRVTVTERSQTRRLSGCHLAGALTGFARCLPAASPKQEKHMTIR